jgi:hypothetical protein
MTIKTNPDSKKLFQLAQSLPLAERRWLRDALNRVVEQEPPSPLVEINVRQILQETFGMWADRDDLPADGVDYVNQIRQSTRWDDMGLAADEVD